MKSLAALSRGRLHICVRLSLKFFPALIRTEKIFSSRKLRVEFTSVLVNFHSANWILRHRSPPSRAICFPLPRESLQNTLLSPSSSKSLTPFAFLCMHLFYLQSHRKILHSPCTLYLRLVDRTMTSFCPYMQQRRRCHSPPLTRRQPHGYDRTSSTPSRSRIQRSAFFSPTRELTAPVGETSRPIYKD